MLHWRTRWSLLSSQSYPLEMNDRSYSGRSLLSSRKWPCHLDLLLLWISSCCAGMPYSRIWDFNHKSSALSVQRPLRDLMCWDWSRKCCSNVSGASDKQTGWRVHLWPSRKRPRTQHQPRPARRLSLARVSSPGRHTVFDHLGSSTQPSSIQRTITQDTQFFHAGSGRGGQNRPNISHRRKSNGAAHAPAAGRCWWVTGRACLEGFAHQWRSLLGTYRAMHQHCRGGGGFNSPITASCSTPGTAARISSRLWMPCCPREL